jgi:predicted nucleotidyltransferase
MTLLNKLYEQKVINCPEYCLATEYLVIMGSFAYGVSGDSSDVDVYGFCIPKMEVVFPHMNGVLHGFDDNYEKFENWQQHHIKYDNKEYDMDIYNIIKYFRLIRDNNPNMIDSLFVPERCILECTDIGKMVRENRHMFLHAGSYYKFKGYAYSQKAKMLTKNPIGKRRDIIDKYGFDTKFGYNLVRLLSECEQILSTGDLDLEKNNEQLKSIRNGEWTPAQLCEYFDSKEKHLEELYSKTKLPYGPREKEIKELLLKCLKMKFGSLYDLFRNDKPVSILTDLKQLIKKYE